MATKEELQNENIELKAQLAQAQASVVSSAGVPALLRKLLGDERFDASVADQRAVLGDEATDDAIGEAILEELVTDQEKEEASHKATDEDSMKALRLALGDEMFEKVCGAVLHDADVDDIEIAGSEFNMVVQRLAFSQPAEEVRDGDAEMLYGSMILQMGADDFKTAVEAAVLQVVGGQLVVGGIDADWLQSHERELTDSEGARLVLAMLVQTGGRNAERVRELEGGAPSTADQAAMVAADKQALEVRLAEAQQSLAIANGEIAALKRAASDVGLHGRIDSLPGVV